MKQLSLTELEKNAQIAFNLRKLRAKRGVSQAELARTVGVSQSLVAMIESGARTLTLPLCMDILVALQCEISELLEGIA